MEVDQDNQLVVENEFGLPLEKPLGKLLWFNKDIEPEIVSASVQWVHSLKSKEGTLLEN